eukprot:scaffold397_cov395-Pavlova_lutheri.AAC.1
MESEGSHHESEDHHLISRRVAQPSSAGVPLSQRKSDWPAIENSAATTPAAHRKPASPDSRHQSMMSRDEGATHAAQVTPSPLPDMVYFPVAPTNSAANPAAPAASPAVLTASPAPAIEAPANPAMVEGEAPTAISHPYNMRSRGNKALEAAATRQWEISNDFSGYARAMARPDADLWQEAITDELTSLAKNGTWRLVPLPPGRTPLTTTWVFKVKTDGDGQVERYKARLCVRGFERRVGVDFHEVFAPTSGKVAQRAFLTYATLVNYEVQQVDIKTAFLNAELNEDIYLQIPEGLKGSMKTTGEEEHVLKLEKSLYGLKQAPRMWHQHLSLNLGLCAILWMKPS